MLYCGNRHSVLQEGRFSQLIAAYYKLAACLGTGCLLALQISGNYPAGRNECSQIEDKENTVNLTIGPFVLRHKPIVVPAVGFGYSYKNNLNYVEKRSNLSLQEFWDRYDGKWPVIITDIIPQWKAYTHWNKDFFLQTHSDDKIVLKSVQGDLRSGTASICDMKTLINKLGQASNNPKSWNYMEDEMFLIDKPGLRMDIGNNYLLEENFFTLFPKEIQPWDCMMLWGTKYSRSTLHMDPYNWTAVSAVIWGKKLWKLFPPGQDQYLYIQPKVKCGFPLECIKYNSPLDAYDADYIKYPEFKKANYIEVEQNHGELLVIPSGWYHQAYNDEETLSISAQLMNRHNFNVVLEEILKGGNLQRQILPSNLSLLPASDQVKLFMLLLPEAVLENGRKVTQMVLDNLNGVTDTT